MWYQSNNHILFVFSIQFWLYSNTFGVGIAMSHELEHEGSRFTAREVKVPASPDDEQFRMVFEDINSVVQSINSGNIVALETILNSSEGVGSNTEINFVIKSGQVSHLTCSDDSKSGFMVNFRKDGTISMYGFGTLEPMTGTVIWFSPLGFPTSYQSVSDGKLLGWQYGWDKQGTLVRKQKIEIPKTISLRGGHKD